MSGVKAANPLIVALDFDSAAPARALVRELGPEVRFYKVGLELYTAGGMHFVRELLESGSQVFLDLKLYDIGETVKRAVACIAGSRVTFLTVHGSKPVMRAAVEGRGTATLKLLAVTVLTSFDQQDLADLGYGCELSELVKLRVRNAVAAGMDGLVCSALDAAEVRRICGPERVIVTPGVRSPSAPTGDQKRVASPAEAIAAGADYLVIGRQITRSPDPRGEAQKIVAEIAQGSARRSRTNSNTEI